MIDENQIPGVPINCGCPYHGTLTQTSISSTLLLPNGETMSYPLSFPLRTPRRYIKGPGATAATRTEAQAERDTLLGREWRADAVMLGNGNNYELCGQNLQFYDVIWWDDGGTPYIVRGSATYSGDRKTITLTLTLISRFGRFVQRDTDAINTVIYTESVTVNHACTDPTGFRLKHSPDGRKIWFVILCEIKNSGFFFVAQNSLANVNSLEDTSTGDHWANINAHNNIYNAAQRIIRVDLSGVVSDSTQSAASVVEKTETELVSTLYYDLELWIKGGLFLPSDTDIPSPAWSITYSDPNAGTQLYDTASFSQSLQFTPGEYVTKTGALVLLKAELTWSWSYVKSGADYIRDFSMSCDLLHDGVVRQTMSYSGQITTSDLTNLIGINRLDVAIDDEIAIRVNDVSGVSADPAKFVWPYSEISEQQTNVYQSFDWWGESVVVGSTTEAVSKI